MSLVDLFNQTLVNTVDDDHGSWRQFILDHLDYITRLSTRYTFSEELINQYRYDLRRFLKESYLKRHLDIGWIVQLLNNLPNDFAFYKGGEYVVPTDDLIDSLYHRYQTTLNNTQ